MQHQRKYSPQIIAIVTAAIALGAAAGAGASTALYIARSSDLSAQLANATSRVMVLESLLQVASDSPAAADLQQPNPAPTGHAAAADEAFAAVLPAPDLPSATQQATASAAPAPTVEPASKPAAAERTHRAQTAPSTKHQVDEDPRRRDVAAKPSQIAPSKAETKAAAVTPAQAPAPGATTTSGVVPVPTPVPAAVPVSQEDVARATARNPVVGVNADKLGVTKLSAAGVQLRSGATIKIGDHFASGERLLSVDPVNNRIVTSARQVLVFFGS